MSVDINRRSFLRNRSPEVYFQDFAFPQRVPFSNVTVGWTSEIRTRMGYSRRLFLPLRCRIPASTGKT